MARLIPPLGLMSLVYGMGWWYFANPYRLLSGKQYLFEASQSQAHQPLYGWMLHVLGGLWGAEPSLLLAQALFWNTATLVLIACFIYRVTQKEWLAFVGSLLFCVSTWPAVYFFLASYAPFAGFLALLSFFLITEAYLDPNKAPFCLVGAGILGSVQLMASLSSVLMVLLQFIFVPLLFAHWKRRERRRLYGCLLWPFAVGVFIFMAVWGGDIYRHISENMRDSQFSTVLSIPKMPFATFYFIGDYYAPGLFYIGLIFSLIFVFYFFDIKRRRTPMEKICFVLSLVVLLHPLLVDVFPFTKVGRVHFIAYPFLITLTTVLSYFWWSKLDSMRAYLGWAIVLLCLWTSGTNVARSLELVRMKQKGAKIIRELGEKTKYYVFEKDIHAEPLERWSGKPLTRIKNISEIPFSPGETAALIIGPHGSGSGKSVFRHTTYSDFQFRLQKPNTAKALSLPFFVYYPPFLMEEPVSQALLFSKQHPDYKEKRLQVSVWLWKNE